MITLYSLLWILLCIFLQVLFFNHLQVFGGEVLIYVIALMKMPFQINRTLQVVVGFLCGLLIDIFSNTLGLHALTCTFIMWIRLPLLHIFILADEVKTGVVSINKLGMSLFVRYAITFISLHTIVLFVTDALTLFNVVPLLIKILVSVLLTFTFTFALEVAVKSE